MAPVKDIGWDDLYKPKFYLLSTCMTLSLRTLLFPANVVRTRLQYQKRGRSLYTGTWDAFKKIYRQEGIRTLYKGLPVNSLFNISGGLIYITMFETARKYAKHYEKTVGLGFSYLVGGGLAPILSQLVAIPGDVISQRLIVRNQGKRIAPGMGDTALKIFREIYHLEGFRGFYSGYFASLSTFIPNSGLWWCFYFYYQRVLSFLTSQVHLDTPAALLQPIAGLLAGVTANCITNPLDITRTRIQIKRASMLSTLKQLWKEEHLRMFTKGFTARLTFTVPFSLIIPIGYENVKRFSAYATSEGASQS